MLKDYKKKNLAAWPFLIWDANTLNIIIMVKIKNKTNFGLFLKRNL